MAYKLLPAGVLDISRAPNQEDDMNKIEPVAQILAISRDGNATAKVQIARGSRADIGDTLYSESDLAALLSENARLREACKNIAAYRVDRFFGDYAAMTSALQHEAVEALIEPENI
jgi:hypothetical protein